MGKIPGIVIVIMLALISVAAQRGSFSPKESSEDNGAFYPRTSYRYPVEDFKPGVVRVGPRTTYLKEGLTIAEVVRFLGKPFSISERTQNNTIVKMYSFQRGEGRMLIVEFENNVLVRSWLETHDNLVVRAG